MCNRCYNTSYYPQGFTSIPLEFTCKKITAEKIRIQNELDDNYNNKMKEQAKERDERRRIINCVSKLQANWRMKKTGHIWGGRLKNAIIDVRIKRRMDKLHQLKKTWWYKVRDTVDKEPILECDLEEDIASKILPRKMYKRDIQRLYPWMSAKQVEKYAVKDGSKPTGIKAVGSGLKWIAKGGPIVKVKNGAKASGKYKSNAVPQNVLVIIVKIFFLLVHSSFFSSL